MYDVFERDEVDGAGHLGERRRAFDQVGAAASASRVRLESLLGAVSLATPSLLGATRCEPQLSRLETLHWHHEQIVTNSATAHDDSRTGGHRRGRAGRVLRGFVRTLMASACPLAIPPSSLLWPAVGQRCPSTNHRPRRRWSAGRRVAPWGRPASVRGPDFPETRKRDTQMHFWTLA